MLSFNEHIVIGVLRVDWLHGAIPYGRSLTSSQLVSRFLIPAYPSEASQWFPSLLSEHRVAVIPQCNPISIHVTSGRATFTLQATTSQEAPCVPQISVVTPRLIIVFYEIVTSKRPHFLLNKFENFRHFFTRLSLVVVGKRFLYTNKPSPRPRQARRP